MSEGIEFNVGGRGFATTSTTLARFGENFLTTITSTDLPVNVDANNKILIDRDPSSFALVLEFLRDGKILSAESESLSTNKRLKQEAEYYSIEALSFYLDQVSRLPCMALDPDTLASLSLFQSWRAKQAEEHEMEADIVRAAAVVGADDSLVQSAVGLVVCYAAAQSFSIEAFAQKRVKRIDAKFDRKVVSYNVSTKEVACTRGVEAADCDWLPSLVAICAEEERRFALEAFTFVSYGLTFVPGTLDISSVRSLQMAMGSTGGKTAFVKLEPSDSFVSGGLTGLSRFLE